MEQLGKGYTLVVQQSTKDPDRMRAVIRDPKGNVYAAGPIVAAKDIAVSKRLVRGVKGQPWADDVIGTGDFLEEMLARFGPIGGSAPAAPETVEVTEEELEAEKASGKKARCKGSDSPTGEAHLEWAGLKGRKVTCRVCGKELTARFRRSGPRGGCWLEEYVPNHVRK